MAVAWITADDVAVALGGAVNPADAWLTSSTAAANAWAFRRRQQAGYADDPAAVPDDAVKQGTVNYAAYLYRTTRGGGDAAQSFGAADGTPTEPTGGWAAVLSLLGVGRADIA